MKATLKSDTELQTKHIRSKQVMVQLFLVIMAMLWCWIPSSIVFLLPVIGYQVSNYLLSWIIIVVVPINSVLDPLLYSLLTPDMRRNFIKFWNRLKS